MYLLCTADDQQNRDNKTTRHVGVHLAGHAVLFGPSCVAGVVCTFTTLPFVPNYGFPDAVRQSLGAVYGLLLLRSVGVRRLHSTGAT